MHIFKNISIVGGSHVSKQSVDNVMLAAETIKPDIVALELDSNRLYSLENDLPRPKNMEMVKAFGISGFLFFLVGEFLQKKIGKYVDMQPGSEMLAAVKYSRANNINMILIDRDIRVTLNRFSKNFKKREVLKIIWDMFFGKQIKLDLHKMPDEELISKIISLTKERYPSLFTILIDERDRFMAKKLFLLSKSSPSSRILAVVGAGHVPGMIRYLNLFEESFK